MLLFVLAAKLDAQPPGWSFADPYQVANEGDANLSEFQVRFVFDHAALVQLGRSREDGADIRFVLECSETEFLPHWIESGVNSRSCVVWIRFPLLEPGTTPFLLLYGNDAAPASSDPDRVFELYDDFEAAAPDPAKWQRSDGTVIVNGALEPVKENLSWGGNNYIYSVNNFAGLANRGVIECEIWSPLGQNGGSIIFFSDDPEAPRHFLLQHDLRSFADDDFGVRDVSVASTFGAGSNFEWEGDERVRYQINLLGGGVDGTRQSLTNGTRRQDLAPTNLPAAWTWNNIGFSSFSTVIGGMRVEYVRVRKYANPEPFVERGGGQSLSVQGGGDLEICAGEEVTLTVLVEGGAPDYSFEWSPADNLDDAGSDSPVAQPDVTTVYTVTVRDQIGCTLSAEVTVTVNPLPTVDAGEDVNLCPAEELQIGREAEGGSPPYTYRWEPITGLDDAASATPTARPDVTTEYTVTVRDSKGCEASDQVVVQVLPEIPFAFPDFVLEFGTLSGCESTRERNFNIANNSNRDATIRELLLNEAEFEIVSPPGSFIVPAGDDVQVTVRFTPAGEGVKTATLTIVTEPCGEEVSLPVRAEKLRAVLTAAPEALDYGASFSCQTAPRDTTIIISNNGTELLTLAEPRLAAPWSLLGPAFPQPLAAGASVEVQLRYQPVAQADYALDATFPFSSASCQDSIVLPLRGLHTDAELSSAESELLLPDLLGCDAEKDTIITVTNSGPAELTIIEVRTDDHGQALQIDQPVLAPGESTTIRVRFSPQSAGSVSSDFVLVYAPCNKTVTVRLTGVRNGPSIAAPQEIDFGDIVLCPGQPARLSLPLVIRSSGGDADATITMSSALTAFDSDIQLNDVIGNNGERSFNLEFIPPASGEFSEELELQFAPCDITRRIRLRGRALTFDLQSAADLDFGEVNGPPSDSRVLRYVNNGETTLTIDADGALAPPFSFTSVPALPAPLGPGEELLVTVVYTAVPGIHSDTLRLRSDPCDLGIATALAAATPRDGFARVRIQSGIQADPGRDLRVPVELIEADNLDVAAADRFRFEVAFNKNLLMPAGASDIGRIDAADPSRRIISVEGRYIPDDPLLAQLDFTALLGDSVCTALEIVSFEWFDATVSTATIDGDFCLTGLCEEGGTRLIHSNGSLALRVAIAPGVLNLDYELIESGPMRIFVSDLLGRSPMLITEGLQLAGRYDLRLPTSALPAGRYFVSLVTPSTILTKAIEVLE